MLISAFILSDFCVSVFLCFCVSVFLCFFFSLGEGQVDNKRCLTQSVSNCSSGRR